MKFIKNLLEKERIFGKKFQTIYFGTKKPTKILNSDNPPFYKWFEDGITNTCYNALDIHIDKGKGDKLAIIYDSPITGSKKISLTMNLNKRLLYSQVH